MKMEGSTTPVCYRSQKPYPQDVMIRSIHTHIKDIAWEVHHRLALPRLVHVVPYPRSEGKDMDDLLGSIECRLAGHVKSPDKKEAFACAWIRQEGKTDEKR